MRRLPLGLISSLILALGLAICPARPAGAQHPLALSGAERQARPDLAKLEDSARELLAKVQAQDQSLAMALAETSTIAAQGAPSRKDPNLAGKYLQEELLPELWTLSVSIKAGQGAATTPWDQADRRQTWLATAYRAAIQELSRTKEKLAEPGPSQPQPDDQRAQLTDLFDQLEKSKESLLEAELRLIREINSLRRNQMSGRETLDQVLELLEQINFQPRPFPDQNQATLEKPMRPVEGPVLANNARLVAQPGPGLWLEAGPDGNVVAPLGGKVVYNDGIKGLGQVLILSHGQNTLGVYANLAQCPLRLGQDLVRGELMGRAGPYRGGTGRALYLELRFQEKPINPTEWFATNP